MTSEIEATHVDIFTEYDNLVRLEESIPNGERDWQEPQFVDNNPTFETTALAQSALPMSPPNSCPVTPTSLTERNFEIKEA
ncbi:Hypothetical predicted protein, partial [Paramuricea clavata]